MIEAAGGAVWRAASRGRLEVLVVHRPRYDDWSLPKGKLHAGESHLDGALREVEEETGFRCQAGPELSEVRYIDRKDRPKRVRYWAMSIVDGAFVANDETDEILWLRTDHAAERLTYGRELPVLADLTSLLLVP